MRGTAVHGNGQSAEKQRAGRGSRRGVVVLRSHLIGFSRSRLTTHERCCSGVVSREYWSLEQPSSSSMSLLEELKQKMDVDSGDGDHAGNDKQRGLNQTVGTAQPSGKSRRNNVIANEKQTANEPTKLELSRGSIISTTRVSNQKPVDDALNAVGEQSPEHHTDPPDSMNGEGDIVMEDDIPQGPGLAEGAADPVV
nr:uncharacterized protein LOC109192712 [Ipomoea batatas]